MVISSEFPTGLKNGGQGLPGKMILEVETWLENLLTWFLGLHFFEHLFSDWRDQVSVDSPTSFKKSPLKKWDLLQEKMFFSLFWQWLDVFFSFWHPGWPTKKMDIPSAFCGAGEEYMGVSKNSGTPKWMVYNGKPY